MAKKRLNKKVVIILVAIGVLAIAGVAGVIIYKQPKTPTVYASRGAEFLKKGEYNSAVRNYASAVRYAKDADPQKPKYLLSLANTLLEWNQKDKTLGDSTRSGNFHEARSSLQKAMLFDPKFVEARRRLTELEYAMFSNPRRPDYKECITTVNKLLALVPDDHEVLYKRAMVHAFLARSDAAYLDLARKDFRALVKLAPRQDRYWFGLVGIRLMSRDGERFKQAEEIYKEALAANKDSARIRINYAQLLIQRDRKDEALKWLNEAVAIRKDEAVGYLALALYYQMERNLDQAVDNFKKAAEAEPANYRSYAGLSRIYSIQNKPAEVLAILRKGLDAVRKDKKPDAKKGKSGRYLVGIVILNYQLCDALLDRSATGAEREKDLQEVSDALKEMQKETSDINKDSTLFARLDPYIAKIEGRLALNDGKLTEAEKLLRRAYDSFRTEDNRPFLEPKTAELLINLYRRLGQPGEAQKIIARLVNVSGGSQLALKAMVQVYVETRQYEQAQRLVRLMLEQNRSDEVMVSIQTGLNVVMGRSNRIPAGLKKPDSLAMLMFRRRAEQLWLEGETESAIQLLYDVLARQPKHLATMAKLIQWHKIRNESAQAKKMLAHARQIYKDNPEVLNQLSMLEETDRKKQMEYLLALASSETDPVRKSLRLASIYRAFRQEKEYLEHLAAAETKDPTNPSVIRQRFVYTLEKGDWASAEKYAAAAAKDNLDAVGGRTFTARIAIARGKLDEAIALLSEALSIRPRFSQAHSFMGNCYLAKGQVDQARQQYELAYSQNPSNVDALVGMIRVSASTNNPDDYAHWVKLAYKFAPKNPRIREAYLRLQSDPEEVIKHREQVRREQPNNLDNLSRLASLYESTGRMAQAEQTFRTMVNISGGSPTTVKVLAYFLYRRKRDVEARGMLAGYAARSDNKTVAYLVWADYLDAVGEADQAEAIYKKAISADPKDARGCLGFARFAARHGRWPQAADYQLKYINITGDKTPLLARKDLIIYLINADKLDDAEKRIDQRLQKDRSDVEMLTLKALIQVKRKDYTKAEKILDLVLKVHPDYVAALVQRAEVHLMNSDKASAVTDLEAARRAGAVPEIVVRLTNLYESMNKADESLIILQGLLEEHPRSAVVLKSLVSLYGRQRRWPALETILADGKKAWPEDPFYHRKETEMWLIRKVPAKAVDAINAAAKLAPDDAGIAFLRMRTLTEAKQYDQALSAGKKLLEHKDLAPSVKAVMALAHAKAGNKSAAETEFSAAVKTAKSGGQLSFVLQQIRSAYPPAQAVEKLKLWANNRSDNAQIYQTLGEILMGQKDLKGAAEYLNKALAGAGTDRYKALLMGRLGLVYFELKQYGTSERMYKSALKIVPDDAGTLNNLAWLLAEDMKKPDQAAPYAKKACELVPDSAEFLDTYGYVLMLEGKYDKALDVLSRSVDKRAMPANRLHLGQVYERMKRQSAAFRQYQLGWELVKNDPGNRYYRKFSEAIKRLGGAPGGSTE